MKNLVLKILNNIYQINQIIIMSTIEEDVKKAKDIFQGKNYAN